jgi:hypothetical protein
MQYINIRPTSPCTHPAHGIQHTCLPVAGVAIVCRARFRALAACFARVGRLLCALRKPGVRELAITPASAVAAAVAARLAARRGGGRCGRGHWTAQLFFLSTLIHPRRAHTRPTVAPAQDGEWKDEFEARIGRFGLKYPSDDS